MSRLECYILTTRCFGIVVGGLWAAFLLGFPAFSKQLVVLIVLLHIPQLIMLFRGPWILAIFRPFAMIWGVDSMLAANIAPVPVAGNGWGWGSRGKEYWTMKCVVECVWKCEGTKELSARSSCKAPCQDCARGYQQDSSCIKCNERLGRDFNFISYSPCKRSKRQVEVVQ